MSESTQHELSNGQKIWLCTFTGQMIEQSKTSSLSISQDAPLVFDKDLVIPGRIRSRTHVEHQIWLCGADGSERAFSIADIGVVALPGHTVSVLWGSTIQNDTGDHFAVRNHQTGDVRSDVMVVGRNLRQWGLKTGAGTSLFMWCLAGALMMAVIAFTGVTGARDTRIVASIGGLFAGGFLGLVAWLVVGKNIGPERRASALVAEIDELAKRRLRDL